MPLDIFNNEKYQSQDYDTKLKVADNYFKQKIETSEKFKSLDAEKQAMVKDKYFADNVGMPETSFKDDARDFGMQLGTGVGTVVRGVGDTYGFISGDMDNKFSKMGKAIEDNFRKEYSTPFKQLEKVTQKEVDKEVGEWNKFLKTVEVSVENPALARKYIVESIPMLVATRGAGTAAKVITGSMKWALNTTLASGAIFQGADMGRETYDTMMKLDDNYWNNVPEYQEALKNGIDPLKAKNDISVGISRVVGGASGLLSFGTNKYLTGGDYLEKTLIGQNIGKGVVKGGVVGGFGEAGTEVFEEGGGKFFQNLGVQQVNPNQPTLQGVGQASGTALVSGGAMGTVAGATNGLVSSPQQNQPIQPQQQPMPQATQEYPKPKTADEILATPMKDLVAEAKQSKIFGDSKAKSEAMAVDVGQVNYDIPQENQPQQMNNTANVSQTLENLQNKNTNQEVQNQDTTLPVSTVESNNVDTNNTNGNEILKNALEKAKEEKIINSEEYQNIANELLKNETNKTPQIDENNIFKPFEFIRKDGNKSIKVSEIGNSEARKAIYDNYSGEELYLDFNGYKTKGKILPNDYQHLPDGFATVITKQGLLEDINIEQQKQKNIVPQIDETQWHSIPDSMDTKISNKVKNSISKFNNEDDFVNTSPKMGAKSVSDILGYIDQNTNGQLNFDEVRNSIGETKSFFKDKINIDNLNIQDADIVANENIDRGNIDLSKPIVIDAKGNIVDGRHRVVFAKQNGITELDAYIPANMFYQKNANQNINQNPPQQPDYNGTLWDDNYLAKLNDMEQKAKEAGNNKAVFEIAKTKQKLKESRIRTADENGKLLFSKKQEDVKDLIVQHNLSEKNLKYVKKINGLLVPSLAITKEKTPLTEFGEITLLGDKDLVNPKGYAKTKVFGADIYSPRFPKENREYKTSDIRKIDKELEKYTSILKNGEIYSSNDIAKLADNQAMKMKFLEEEKGVSLEIPKQKNPNEELISKAYPEEYNYSIQNKGIDWLSLYKEENFKQKVVADLNSRLEARGRSMSYTDEQISNIARDRAQTIDQIGRNQGKPDYYAMKDLLRQEIEKFRSEYEDYVENFKNKYDYKSFFYDNNKKKKFDESTILKYLTSNLRGGENFNYGAGSVRAMVTPEFKTLEQIKKAKEKLVTPEDFKPIAKSIEDELLDIATSIAAKSGNQFINSDIAIEFIQDYSKRGRRAIPDYDVDVNNESLKRIDEFLNKLKELPTEYFEAKITRDVSPAEFRVAVVPENVSKETLDYLTKQGLKIKTYKKGDETDRKRAISEATKENDLLFSQFKQKNSTTVEEHYKNALSEKQEENTINVKDFKDRIAGKEKEIAGLVRSYAYAKKTQPKTTFRGVADKTKLINQESGAASEGYGLYTTLNKKLAEDYGQVIELDGKENTPKNPLAFSDYNQYEIFMQQLMYKVAGYKRASDFGSLNPNEIVNAILPDIDGIQIGTGKKTFWVKFPDINEVREKQKYKVLESQFKQKNSTTVAEAINQAKKLLGNKFNQVTKGIEFLQSANELPKNIKDALYSIFAYHGTPHNVDSFSTKYIGTGEGAQAYGWGMYFADSKEVAEFYRTSNMSRDNRMAYDKAVEEIKNIKSLIEEAQSNPKLTSQLPKLEEFLAKAEKTKQDLSKSGNLYKVELKPKEEEYLLWDKPLSEQSLHVKKMLEKKFSLPSFNEDFRTAGEFYKSRERKYNNSQKASQELNDLGIKGIKYLDGNSRNEEQENYNYVIFADENVGTPELLMSGGIPRGIFDPKTNKIYLIADTMKANEVQGVILHELLHRAINGMVKNGQSRLETILGSGLKPLTDRLNQLASQGDKRVKEAFKRVKDANVPKENQLEETMTYLLENYTNDKNNSNALNRWIKDTIQAIKDFIRKVAVSYGIEPNWFISRMNVDDIATVLRSTAIDGKENLSKGNILTSKKSRLDEWHKDSHPLTKNEDGTPKVFYHGTNAEFEVFDMSKAKSSSKAKPSDLGFWFTNSKDYAEFHGDNIMEVYANIKNPKVYTKEDFASKIKNTDFSELRNQLINQGYDGVITKGGKEKLGGFEVENPDNLVSFNNTQIKSVNNQGTFDETNPNILYTKQGYKDRHKTKLDKLKKWAKDKVYDIANTKGISSLLYVTTRQEKVDMFADITPELQVYDDLVESKLAEANRIAKLSGEIAEKTRKWAVKNKVEADKLFKFMGETTISGIDPTKTFKEQKQKAEQFYTYVDKVGIEYDNKDRAKLTEERYNFIKAKWDNLSPDAKEIYSTMKDHYERLADKMFIALKNKITEAEIDGNSKVKLIDKLRLEFEDRKVSGPYFPLMRFGEYIVTGKDANGELVSERYETPSERDNAADEMAKEGYTNIKKSADTDKKVSLEADTAFMSDILNQIENANPIAFNDISDSVYQLYLKYLPNMSARKSYIHRKGIQGYSDDMLRVFAAKTFHLGRQIANINHLDKMQKQIDKLEKRVKKTGDPKLKAIYDDLLKTHEHIVNPEFAQWQVDLTSLGFYWYMTSLSAGALNLTQVALVVFPKLTGKYGANKSMYNLVKSAKDLTIDNLTQDEKAFMEKMKDSGIIDLTMTHDLAGLGDHYNDIKYGPMTTVKRVLAIPQHYSEVANRMVTLLTTYRLAKDKGIADPTREAIKINYETNFNYTNENRNRLMRSPAMKVVTQFKNYSVQMLYFMLKHSYMALKGDKEAMKTMGTLIAMSFALSGAKGLPLQLYYLIAGVAGSEDPEDELYANIKEIAGEYTDLVWRGVVNYLTGADIGGRTGLNDMLVKQPTREMNTKDTINFYTTQVLGPTLGIFTNFAVGISDIANGEAGRGIEKTMPKPIKDIIQTYRFGTEGARDYDFKPLIEEFKPYELGVKTIGFQPESLAKVQESNMRQLRVKARIDNERDDILKRLRKADFKGDEKLWQESMQEIRDFNSKYPNLAIKNDTIRRSLKGADKDRANAENGLNLPPKYRSETERYK